MSFVLPARCSTFTYGTPPLLPPEFYSNTATTMNKTWGSGTVNTSGLLLRPPDDDDGSAGAREPVRR